MFNNYCIIKDLGLETIIEVWCAILIITIISSIFVNLGGAVEDLAAWLFMKFYIFFNLVVHFLPCSLQGSLLHGQLVFQDCFFFSPFIVELGAELGRHFFLNLLMHLLRLCFFGGKGMSSMLLDHKRL